ncbi:hypothetical protein [Coraliomargarita akajimensis]|uniref:Secreted protein n=1 Tax=Coraliomargarita akajimensis (strain DSM 45221 / IAM 15411 / JCM 23193 / KCTC 12865 / 04OKA010-24) TaxID=583355 RepID=D5EKX4_CORAD|nr:hypothetical protein [Coraliomargarita akajimensis]ADE53076.1 hypothetical protein Caka_0047 [Coraliomargarita akajimensis DSM 45221]
MRYFVYSLIALLPFMGLSLNAAAICDCEHDAAVELGAVPCCTEQPESCCMQTQPENTPLKVAMALHTQPESPALTLSALTTLTEDRAKHRPHAGVYYQRPRPPPLRSSEHRCYIQSWLN